jgi:hypothetical protein
MVATVQVEQITGAAPGTFTRKDNSGVAKSGTRYMTSDQSDGSLTTYPIPIPTAGQGASGSYWVTHCLNVTVAPDTYIKDVKYYQTWSTDPNTDWALSTGVTGTPAPGLYIGVSSASIANCKVFSQGFPSSSYDVADGTEGTCGNILSGNHDWYSNVNTTAHSGGMVPIEHFDTLANAIMVHSGQVTHAHGGGSPSANSFGRTYCILTQVVVGSGATAGEADDKTATWVYSEA